MNEEATEFFNRHGWVVINQRLDKMTVNEARTSWIELRERCAQEMGVAMDTYRKEISQWRDLWTHGFAFLNLLDYHEQVRGVAQEGMDWSFGCCKSHHRQTCGRNQQENSLASRFDVLAS